MINLEQIQSLEQKVNKAVELIARLREENKKLRQKIQGSTTKTRELETLVNTFKQEQDAIEKGILNVLSKLDRLEDEVSVTGSTNAKDSPSKASKKQEPAAREPKAEQKDQLSAIQEPEEKTETLGEDLTAAPKKNQEELDIF